MTVKTETPTLTTAATTWTTTIDHETGTVEIRFAADRPTILVGADVAATSYDRIAAGGPLAGARVCRTFSAPGEQILPWTHPKRQKFPKPSLAEHLSWKDWPDDTTVIAWINTLLDGMPAHLIEDAPLLPELHPWREPWQGPDTSHDGFSLLLTWAHEGEPDCIAAGITPREWRRRHRIAYDTIRAHRNGGRVGYMSIQTGTWTQAHSTPGKVKGDFDPITWWSGTGDFAGYDAYVPTQDKLPVSLHDYPDPAVFFTTARALATGAGRPLYLPELGVVKQGRPGAQDDGSVRAQWLMRVVPYLRSISCAAVSWWDGPGANGRDFRLDPISLKAWKDAIAGRL